MTIQVLVAAHKPYRMPEDRMYLPVFVGAAVNDPEGQMSRTPELSRYPRDDTGDNISRKNPYYCELTALYWGWKNLDAEYLGLAHYRRHFVRKRDGDIWENLLSEEQARTLFQKGYQAILPKKRHYVIETLYSHYEHTHHAQDLIATSDVISECFPEYVDSYVKVMKRRSAHMFNMFIVERSLADAYCEWLFAVLFQVEKRLDISSYSAFDQRVFGRISELLLDVWLDHHQVRYTEVPVRNTEGEHLLSKIVKVLRLKLKG